VTPGDRRDKEEYLDALNIEMEGVAADFRPRSVYIGGGTPTVLNVDELKRLFSILQAHVDLEQVSEFTMEANPGTLTSENTALIKEMGVNRVSLGAQTFDSEVLKLLGRGHSAEDVQEAWRILADAGIANRSLDLMFAVPGTGRDHMLADCKRLLELDSEHVSAYALSIEEGTPLHFQYESGLIEAMDEDIAREQYDLLREFLADNGYRHYEISNFSKEGFECLHNQLYWSGGEYIGCGPSAHSHWRGRRFSNTANLWQYTRSFLAGTVPIGMEETLADSEKACETLVMSLRRLEGVEVEDFENRTGFSPYQLRGEEIERLIDDGLLELSANRLRLTEQALFISDTVFRELV